MCEARSLPRQIRRSGLIKFTLRLAALGPVKFFDFCSRPPHSGALLSNLMKRFERQPILPAWVNGEVDYRTIFG